MHSHPKSQYQQGINLTFLRCLLQVKQKDLGIDKTKPDSKTVSIIITLFDDERCWTKFCRKHEMNKSGSIEAIIGPMFSGKTTELLRRVRRYSHRQKSCVVVKYAGDLRYSSKHVVSYDGQSLEAIVTLTPDEVYEKMSQYDVVGKLWYLAFPFFFLNNCSKIVSGIDEGQFFDDIVEMSDQLAMAGLIVVVAALIGNQRREGFKKFSISYPNLHQIRC